MRRNKTTAAVLAAMMAVMAASCSEKPKQAETEKPQAVEVYTPGSAEAPHIVTSGRIEAENTALVATRVMGFVDKIYVSEGDRVTKGQLLLTVNSTDIAAQQAQARAALSSAEAACQMAERDYSRYSNLYQQGSASPKELERVQLGKTTAASQVEMARQALKEVGNMLSYTRIRAPFAGVVTRKMIDEGSTASPGMPLMAIEQGERLNVSALIPESVVGSVAKGDEVTVSVKAADTEFRGRIVELSSSATLTGGQYSAKISIAPEAAPKLKSGMYASVAIRGSLPAGEGGRLSVEKSSIVSRGQLQGVYVVGPQHRASLRWLRLGHDDGVRVEVISGLGAADRVVRNPGAGLNTGDRVTVK